MKIISPDNQALERTAPVLPMLPGTPERRSFDYVRHGTIDLFAALNTATGKVIGKLSAQHRAVDFRDFLDEIDRQVDPGFAVHVICDNLSAHKAPVVHRWLLAHPRFVLHFTPTYSSWINQVERWLAELQRRCLERGVFCSLDEPTTALEDWIKLWNASARPFKWTKTADQIIDRICRYCSRISGPGHWVTLTGRAEGLRGSISRSVTVGVKGNARIPVDLARRRGWWPRWSAQQLWAPVTVTSGRPAIAHRDQSLGSLSAGAVTEGDDVRIPPVPARRDPYDRQRERARAEVDMDSRQTVMALYGAYATGDADQIAGLLHEEVVWTAPAGNATQVALGLGRPEDAGPPRGANDLDREAIVAFMAYNFARFFGGADNEFRTVVAEGDVVVVEHRLSATLPDGRPYVNDYCFVYEVRDGKVWRIREYMDTRGGWAQVFGEGEPVQLIEFTGQ